MRSVVLLVMGSLAALSLAPAASIAGPASPRGRGAKTDLLKQGVRLFSHGRFKRSLRVLELAHKRAAKRTVDRRRTAKILLFIGLNHAVGGRSKLAKQAFSAALAHDADLRLEARRFKHDLQQIFDRVRDRLVPLAVSADLDGAVVVVDGKVIGAAPLRARLGVGQHVVEVRREGAVYQTSVELSLGRPASVRAVLRRAEPFPAAAGSRRQDAPSFWGRRRLWTWVAAGAAVAVSAASIGVWASANSTHKNEFTSMLKEYDPGAPDARVQFAELESKAGSISDRVLAARVLAGVAGGLAISAAVLLYFEGRPSPERSAGRGLQSVRVAPLWGEAAGATVVGRF
jgi:anti-sigma-K factor RskA